MDERPELYEQIVEEYKKTGSVKQVVENLGSNVIKVRRVLITEGLWESKTSRNVGDLYSEGKSTKEIAEELCISEKNVQSYLPYSRGAYGGEKSGDATRSKEYRDRMKNAADNQAPIKESKKDIKEADLKTDNKIVVFDKSKTKNKGKKTREDSDSHDRLPGVLKLRFELVAPYYSRRRGLDMEPEEKKKFLRHAKAKEGIIREALVHGETNLHALHYMIQKLFGWQNSHLHHYSLTDADFDKITDKQKMDRYFSLCGSIFRFPGAEMDDQFWDDDYEQGVSFKTWLRCKYVKGFRDLAVENSYWRTQDQIRDFNDHFGKKIKSKKATLDKVSDVVMFEDGFNTLIEGLSVRNIFKTCLPPDSRPTFDVWKSIQDLLIERSKADYDEFKRIAPDDHQAILDDMQDLIALRKNVLTIDQAIRYGRSKEIKDFYKMNPEEVIRDQEMAIEELEEMLEPFLSPNNPVVIPFAEELYYIYDYGDDWCVRITCEDAYTASENYDQSNLRTHKGKSGRKGSDQRISEADLQYVDRSGVKVDPALREKLQTVYLKGQPICVLADGLNVMDDVGGLYGYQRFLEEINSNDPDGEEEKESSMVWARGMGWTGRKKKPESIL